MKRHVCIQQHLLLTSLEAKTRKAARMLISECATLENKEKKTCPQSLMKIRLRQHLHIKIYHVTHERILMFLMLPTADMCFDKRFSKSTDQKLLTPHNFFFNWGESSEVSVRRALTPCDGRTRSMPFLGLL